MVVSDIAGKAAEAAAAMMAEPAAPASNQCCAAGQEAFAISETTLAAEYAAVEVALAAATAELTLQAENNQLAWIVAESQIQQLGALNGSPTYIANEAAKITIAEANSTENAFETAEAFLVAETGTAEVAILTAESVMSAEYNKFMNDSGCAEAAE